jgi:predicted Zn-dependent protease
VDCIVGGAARRSFVNRHAGAGVIVIARRHLASRVQQRYSETEMSTTSEETARIAASLPPDKAEALLEFARYLAEKADEQEWDRRFSDPRYSAKLTKMADEARTEFHTGQTQPLDPDSM